MDKVLVVFEQMDGEWSPARLYHQGETTIAEWECVRECSIGEQVEVPRGYRDHGGIRLDGM